MASHSTGTTPESGAVAVAALGDIWEWVEEVTGRLIEYNHRGVGFWGIIGVYSCLSLVAQSSWRGLAVLFGGTRVVPSGGGLRNDGPLRDEDAPLDEEDAAGVGALRDEDAALRNKEYVQSEEDAALHVEGGVVRDEEDDMRGKGDVGLLEGVAWEDKGGVGCVAGLCMVELVGQVHFVDVGCVGKMCGDVVVASGAAPSVGPSARHN